MLSNCIEGNNFGYLSLIFSNFDKNKIVSTKIVKSYKRSSEILLSWLKSSNSINNPQFMNDYFQVLYKVKYYGRESTFYQCIAVCKNNDKLAQYIPIIEENCKKLRDIYNGKA